MANALSNARHPTETFKNYRARLKLVAQRVEQVLRGQYSHVSSQIVEIPIAGADEKTEEAIRRRELREVLEVVRPDGKAARIARTKGVTCRVYPTGRDRREWRELQFSFPQVLPA